MEAFWSSDIDGSAKSFASLTQDNFLTITAALKSIGMSTEPRTSLVTGCTKAGDNSFIDLLPSASSTPSTYTGFENLPKALSANEALELSPILYAKKTALPFSILPSKKASLN